jgi:hypothetical protein
MLRELAWRDDVGVASALAYVPAPTAKTGNRQLPQDARLVVGVSRTRRRGFVVVVIVVVGSGPRRNNDGRRRGASDRANRARRDAVRARSKPSL